MLQCDHEYNDIIKNFRDYLFGYIVGKAVFNLAEDKSSVFINTDGDLRDISYSPMKEFNPATQMYKTLKRKDEACADDFDSGEVFYNLGRADALLLNQNNSECLAIILSCSKMYRDAVKDVWQYLKGFYY